MGEVIEFRRKRLTGLMPAEVGKKSDRFPQALSTVDAILVACSEICVAFIRVAAAAWPPLDDRPASRGPACRVSSRGQGNRA